MQNDSNWNDIIWFNHSYTLNSVMQCGKAVLVADRHRTYELTFERVTQTISVSHFLFCRQCTCRLILSRFDCHSIFEHTKQKWAPRSKSNWDYMSYVSLWLHVVTGVSAVLMHGLAVQLPRSPTNIGAPC